MKTILQFSSTRLVLILMVFLGLNTWTSCVKKTAYLENGGILGFSEDTLKFDTVFSSTKTSTHVLKIFNKENYFVKVNINLANGDASSYDLSIDGKTGKHIQDIEIGPSDSTMVFVTMKVDPNDEDIPFVVEDRLVAQLNSNEFSIPIIGYAQNAYYINDSVLNTMTFATDKPYVILNSALVAKDAVVTIPEGVKIYMHRNSRLFVQGTLKMMGSLENKIEIQSDRIDRRIYVGSYEDVPGEWGGIYFLSESHNNEIHHAIIKNGGLSTRVGEAQTLPAMIQVDEDTKKDGTPKLKMYNTIIKNSVAYGLVAFESSIEAENCVIVNSQDLTLALLQGGKYVFNDCTIGSPGGIRFFSRMAGTVSVAVQNFYSLTQTTYRGSDLFAQFKNCIIYGYHEEEFIAAAKEDFAVEVILDHCLVRHKEPIPDFVSKSSLIINKDPMFSDLSTSDFRLSESSPLIYKGISAGVLSDDIDGVPRAEKPSIGAYEYKP